MMAGAVHDLWPPKPFPLFHFASSYQSVKHSVIPGSAKVVRRELVDKHLDEMGLLVSEGQHTMARRTLGASQRGRR